MWSSSGDSIGHLLNEEIAQRLAKKLLELVIEGADAAHIVPFGGRHVRADVGPHVFEVPSMLEDGALRGRIFPDARLQQVEGKLRVDHLLGGELRQYGRPHRVV